MSQDRFCAICEQKLGEKDSEHVCRTCFRKAREPKETQVLMTNEAAEKLGFAYAFGNFINWGIQTLVDLARVKMPPPPKDQEEAARREAAAREELHRIQREIKSELDGEKPDVPDPDI